MDEDLVLGAGGDVVVCVDSVQQPKHGRRVVGPPELYPAVGRLVRGRGVASLQLATLNRDLSSVLPGRCNRTADRTAVAEGATGSCPSWLNGIRPIRATGVDGDTMSLATDPAGTPCVPELPAG